MGMNEDSRGERPRWTAGRKVIPNRAFSTCQIVPFLKMKEMITHNETTTTIQCDKCKRESIAPNASYNEWFFDEGWALNRGKKYEHLCRKCLPKKSRDAMDWYKDKFKR